MHAPNGHLVDEWIIGIAADKQRYEYPIFMDPYALKPYENPFESWKTIYGFTLDR